MHTQFSVLKDISLDRSFGAITQDISFDNLVAWKLMEYQWIAYFLPMGWARKLGGSGSVIPATAAGVTDRLWEMTDVVEMIEAWEATEQRKAAWIGRVSCEAQQCSSFCAHCNRPWRRKRHQGPRRLNSCFREKISPSFE
jgi:hypothetical protein